MGKSTKRLKAALQSQQSRFKAKEKLSHATQLAEQKSRKEVKGKGKGKAKTKSHPRRITIPFRTTDKILLIGEGNFSFARALLKDQPLELRGLRPSNITATAYDTEDECYEKYPEAHGVVSTLREAGAEVLFGVDGTQLERIKAFRGQRWDRIVWNFPHGGKGITDQNRNILSNQVLILGFLRSASKFLVEGPVPSYISPRKKKSTSDDDDEEEEETVNLGVEGDGCNALPTPADRPRGTILVTLRNVPPYTLWDVPRLAKKPPLPSTGSAPPNPKYTLLRSFTFERSSWKGYEHRMTKGERAHGTGSTGSGGEDRTWEFCLRDEVE